MNNLNSIATNPVHSSLTEASWLSTSLTAVFALVRVLAADAASHAQLMRQRVMMSSVAVVELQAAVDDEQPCLGDRGVAAVAADEGRAGDGENAPWIPESRCGF